MMRLEGVGHELGRRTLFADVSIVVEAGCRLALLGPSGAGKTTLLRIVAGLEAPRRGDVYIAGAHASRAGEVLVPPHERGIGFAFQAPLLWPHLDVGHNVAFGVRGRSRAYVGARVADLLARCGLEGFAERFPDELSGGEAARVALARALAPEPRILLLDEPFASVEAELRERLATVVTEVLESTGAALVYATHEGGVVERLGGARLELTRA
jgi:iron(III) transport system ATP-binding protein